MNEFINANEEDHGEKKLDHTPSCH